MRLLFLLVFIISSSFAIAIDKTWYENTNENLEKIYSEQTKKIDSTKSSLPQEEKEQADYQLLLLKKLTNLLKQDNQFTQKEISKIENLDDYVKKIKEYLKIDSDYLTEKKEFEDNLKKIEILDEQITKLTDKESIQTINSQLLYAYYTLKNKQNKSTLDEYTKFQDEFKKKLLSSLNDIKLPSNDNLATKLSKVENSYNQIIKDEKKLSLALDKASISENESKILLSS